MEKMARGGEGEWRKRGDSEGSGGDDGIVRSRGEISVSGFGFFLGGR